MTFTQKAWERSQPVLEEICKHPFVTELISGSLEEDCFAFYLKQDWMYLNDYAQALASTSLLAPNNRDAAHLIKFAHGAAMVEQELHLKFLHSYNTSEEAKLSPACFHYTNFLRATIARGDYASSLTALLPCFWIYQHVGQHISNLSVEDNPYKDWINTYAGEEFADSVETMIEMTNQSLRHKNAAEQENAIRIFKIASLFEFQFWDDAYHRREHDIEIIIGVK